VSSTAVSSIAVSTTAVSTTAVSRAGRAQLQWRRWRAWLIIGLIVLLGGVGVAAVHQQPANQYLNPGTVTADGSHALADVLTRLGHQVITATSVPAAVQAAIPGSTLVITSPQYLSADELSALARVRAGVLLVGPDPAALAVLAPPVTVIGATEPVVVTAPACRLRAATLAGTADMGGRNLLVADPAAAAQCYTSTSGPTLVQLQVRGRTVTVLGTGAPLTNAELARAGNAALAVDLLPSRRIVWLVPAVVAVIAATTAGPRTFASLLPLSVYLVTIQLGVAALVAAAWRARRLGHLVTEPLPVVVRAAETTEGHGRLYQSRHARAQAAEALRGALRSRLERAIGLPHGAGQDAVVAALASRSSADSARISELVFGPPPATDQALLALARELDQLEREVGTT
jgi:Domain of unknown function (DUF4350)